MNLPLQGQLILAFTRIGLLGFGGGPSMIPLVHAEVVKRYEWMSEDDFSDVLAIGNTLPGPIATKMAGYIGYRVGGMAGCIGAVLAVTLPCIIAMIALLGLFMRYRDERWINGMSQGVIPVVMVMMARLTWDFWAKARSSLGAIATVVLAVVSAGLMYGLGVHPGLIIGALLIAALLRPEPKQSTRS
ncbi:chromate transporter [Larsenimonas rhizosphaerae]|uniref:Chromate transporter n=1 Tax=Larsenimonas rhizosphaerae TaxID=2944682 RepID=A0AA41ZF16_9GAMM|nr:chromate transporter [Larsenimonas rhizosphaerae]MCM2129994.1 chromate transporter [Larsenimonas rhizosphaerae]MCX2522693.1 chromate transporter [Larsenimonas rhizosphaerae]